MRSTYEFAMGILEQCMILWVLVDHHIEVLSALRILNIQPNLLATFTPIAKVSFLNITPNMLQLFTCDSFGISEPKNLTYVGLDFLYGIKNFKRMLDWLGINLVDFTQFHRIRLLVNLRE